MTLRDLTKEINTPIFSRTDLLKLFPDEPTNQINTQLYRMIKRGELVGIKRGLYSFPNSKVDEFVLANKIYTPSYVSLESALNIYGIIPDIVANITSVTPVTSKRFNTALGTYIYSKINKSLYFGYESVLDNESKLYYNIASPEKALLDYIYVRKIKDLKESRVDTRTLKKKELFIYLSHFPVWVKKVVEDA